MRPIKSGHSEHFWPLVGGSGGTATEGGGTIQQDALENGKLGMPSLADCLLRSAER